MRRAQQCRARRQSAAVLPSYAPHDSKARLQTETNRRDSWRRHVHRTHTAQRVQLFKAQTANVGGRGGLPSPFSGGSKGGILFGKRIPPFIRSPMPMGHLPSLSGTILSSSPARQRRRRRCRAGDEESIVPLRDGRCPIGMGLRIKGGILFPKRIPPLDPPEKGEGSPPRPPTLAV